MADSNVYEALKELLQNIFGDSAVAAQVAADPQGALAAYGITDYEDLDFRQAAAETYGDYDLPYGSQSALESYASGTSAPGHYPVQSPPAYAGGYQAPADAVAHVQYATYAAYEQHPQITQEIVNTQQLLFVDQSTTVDNSTDVAVDVDGNLNGDVTVAPENATALGEQSVATTGDGNLISTGDGDITTVEDVDGTVLVDSEIDGDGNVLGDNEGIVVGGDVEDAALANNGDAFAATGDGSVAGEEVIANTGSGDQLLASDGSVLNANTGDGDQFVAGENANLVAATGEDSVAIGGDSFAPVVTGEVGDGTVLADDIEGAVNTGELDGAQIAAGENSSVEAQVQTGDGFQAAGDVSETVVGDENQTANLDLSTGGADGGTGGNANGGTSGDSVAGAGGAGGDAGSAANGSTAAGGAGGSGGSASGGSADGGAGGSADGGTSGGIEDITINFGDGNLTETDVSDSAVSANGDAENNQAFDSFNTENFNAEESFNAQDSFNGAEGLGEVGAEIPEPIGADPAVDDGQEVVAG